MLDMAIVRVPQSIVSAVAKSSDSKALAITNCCTSRSLDEFHCPRASKKTIHVRLEPRPIRRLTPDSLPDEHGADHHIGSRELIAEQIRSVTEFTFDHVFHDFEFGPAALRQRLKVQQRSPIAGSSWELE